jgi:phage terminase large subunit-like protein
MTTQPYNATVSMPKASVTNRVPPMKFLSLLRWLDKKPLIIEPYRARIFEKVLWTFDESGRLFYTMALLLRAKKNNKSLDAILAMLYALMAWQVPGGFIGRMVAFDEDQINQNLDLLKKLIAVNPVFADALVVKQKEIERRDGGGYCRIIPGRDILGAHGGTSDFDVIDEIQTQKSWSLMEALAPDPSKQCLQWITSYNSLFHRPLAPLFDLLKIAWSGSDQRMFFSYYAADRTNDPDFQDASPQLRANPSMASWENQNYLAQQKLRTPSHVYRRLHMNLPGAPEGAAFSAEKIMDSVERGTKARLREPGAQYVGFVDMSGGSRDDACLAIAHKDADGRAVLDLIVNQGAPVPFDPLKTVVRFAQILKAWGLSTVVGDAYAGLTYVCAFSSEGIGYHVSEQSKHEIYQACEAPLNANNLILLDEPKLESEMLGLIWRGNKIDHGSGSADHDDWANGACGALNRVLGAVLNLSTMYAGGQRVASTRDWTSQGDDYGGRRFDW